MSWTKKQLVEASFTEVGLANYIFALQVPQLQAAVRKLDNMVARWVSAGISIGYPLNNDPDGIDINQETGIPIQAVSAVVLNFAIELAPGYGKAVAPETKVAAKQAYQAILIKAVQPLPRQLPSGTAAGEGNRKSVYGGYFPDPEDQPITGEDDMI